MSLPKALAEASFGALIVSLSAIGGLAGLAFLPLMQGWTSVYSGVVIALLFAFAIDRHNMKRQRDHALKELAAARVQLSGQRRNQGLADALTRLY